jgi:phosphopantothenoylcysteine decarboxylase/phosphopantothenate--cysteine ligase
MAAGLADDLAANVLLATDKPVLIAPAMNPLMWSHPATVRNVAWLRETGVSIVGPNVGAMAERGEFGAGRMAEPMEILAAIEAHFGPAMEAPQPLAGRHVVITSGPTHEPIDPVRYIANRSSGKQGHAIAAAAIRAGARVTLVAGPVTIPDPKGADVVHVETAQQMLTAVQAALPADIAIFAAAVADWRVDGQASEKIKKGASGTPDLHLVENPDILATIGHHPNLRPKLVIGFAAETQNLLANAEAKLKKKGADFIVANDVSPATGIMGGDRNSVRIVGHDGVEAWPEGTKDEVATALIEKAATYFG